MAAAEPDTEISIRVCLATGASVRVNVPDRAVVAELQHAIFSKLRWETSAQVLQTPAGAVLAGALTELSSYGLGGGGTVLLQWAVLDPSRSQQHHITTSIGQQLSPRCDSIAIAWSQPSSWNDDMKDPLLAYIRKGGILTKLRVDIDVDHATRQVVARFGSPLKPWSRLIVVLRQGAIGRAAVAQADGIQDLATHDASRLPIAGETVVVAECNGHPLEFQLKMIDGFGQLTESAPLELIRMPRGCRDLNQAKMRVLDALEAPIRELRKRVFLDTHHMSRVSMRLVCEDVKRQARLVARTVQERRERAVAARRKATGSGEQATPSVIARKLTRLQAEPAHSVAYSQVAPPDGDTPVVRESQSEALHSSAAASMARATAGRASRQIYASAVPIIRLCSRTVLNKSWPGERPEDPPTSRLVAMPPLSSFSLLHCRHDGDTRISTIRQLERLDSTSVVRLQLPHSLQLRENAQ